MVHHDPSTARQENTKKVASLFSQKLDAELSSGTFKNEELFQKSTPSRANLGQYQGTQTKEQSFAQNIFPENQRYQQDLVQLMQVGKMKAVSDKQVSFHRHERCVGIQNKSAQAKLQAMAALQGYVKDQGLENQLDPNSIFQHPSCMEQLQKYFAEQRQQEALEEETNQLAQPKPQKKKTTVTQAPVTSEMPSFGGKAIAGVCSCALVVVGLNSSVDKKEEATSQLDSIAALEQELETRRKDSDAIEKVKDGVQKQMSGG